MRWSPLVLCVLSCCAAAQPSEGVLWRCESPVGHVTLSDHPCGAGAQSQPIPQPPMLGSRSPLRESAKQWTNRVACENRQRELSNRIDQLEWLNRQARERQRERRREHRKAVAEARPSQGSGSTARERELRQARHRDAERYYDDVIRDNRHRQRELRRSLDKLRCSRD